MAVYCGVCASRISAAWENGGSFRTTSEFKGWSNRINDTCESCARILSEAVTKAAMKLVAKNQRAINFLRQEHEDEEARQERLKNERAAFEREWTERKSRIT